MRRAAFAPSPARSLAGVGNTPFGGPRVVSTNFDGTEAPISEGGLWINGGVTGLDWANCEKTSGLAHGASPQQQFRDATAILAGPWSRNQEVEAIYTGVDALDSQCSTEVELRLLSIILAHINSGIEVFRKLNSSTWYTQCALWFGDPEDFELVFNEPGPQPQNGDVFRARAEEGATSNVSDVSLWVNDTLITTIQGLPFSSGAPGMGFYPGSSCLASSGAGFGFVSLTARDLAA